MKKILPILLVALILASPGCAWMERHTPWHHNDATTSKASPTKTQKPDQTQTKAIVTPDESLEAKVMTVNSVGRFVVLNFPTGRLPKLDQHMFLYRAGLKTAEVKVVGPQQDTSIVADIVSGDAQTGDTVREQ